MFGCTTNLRLLDATPSPVVTDIAPVVAPSGTVEEMRRSDSTANEAETPLNDTAEAPVNPLPRIETSAPTGPRPGENPVISGGTRTVKSKELVAVPSGVVTVIGPVVAPSGTVAVIWVSSSTAKVGSGVPLKATSVAPVKPEPVMVTVVPTVPCVGENPVIVGSTAPAGVPTTATSAIATTDALSRTTPPPHATNVQLPDCSLGQPLVRSNPQVEGGVYPVVTVTEWVAKFPTAS